MANKQSPMTKGAKDILSAAVTVAGAGGDMFKIGGKTAGGAAKAGTGVAGNTARFGGNMLGRSGSLAARAATVAPKITFVVALYGIAKATQAAVRKWKEQKAQAGGIEATTVNGVTAPPPPPPPPSYAQPAGMPSGMMTPQPDQGNALTEALSSISPQDLQKMLATMAGEVNGLMQSGQEAGPEETAQAQASAGAADGWTSREDKRSAERTPNKDKNAAIE
ncbi:MAG: hypothetical protein ACPG80_05645, partial [Rickettsiales bacterium]